MICDSRFVETKNPITKRLIIFSYLRISDTIYSKTRLNTIMSVFDLPQALESINAGASRYDCTQMYPISGNVASALVGAGSASGLSTFQWSDSNLWWSPVLSYFVLQVKFLKANGAPATTDYVAYCDNFVDTLFSQIKFSINGRQLDIIDQPAIIGTALTYANNRKSFIESWDSMSHVGEGFMTRLKNTVANGGTLEIAFRPPISVFAAKLLPPGAQFKVDFNWAPNANAAFESVFTDVVIGTGSNQFQIQVDSFSFYKTTLAPASALALPEAGVIDLSSTIIQQYFLNSGSQLKQNITMPSTTNRILVCCQDQYRTQLTGGVATDGGNQLYTPGVGTGWNPATSFSFAFTDSTNAVPFNAPISQLYLTLPEIGVQLPNPVYTFNTVTAGTATVPSVLVMNQADIARAYADFCTVCQGTSEGVEGSVPLGTMNYLDGAATAAVAPLGGASLNLISSTMANSALRTGDPNNSQRAVLSELSGAANLTMTPVGKTIALSNLGGIAYQTGRWGWSGRCPGPIFAFPIVRPEGKAISTGNLNITFGASIKNVVINVLCTYSMALSCQHVGNGLYSYQINEGI